MDNILKMEILFDRTLAAAVYCYLDSHFTLVHEAQVYCSLKLPAGKELPEMNNGALYFLFFIFEKVSYA